MARLLARLSLDLKCSLEAGGFLNDVIDHNLVDAEISHGGKFLIWGNDNGVWMRCELSVGRGTTFAGMSESLSNRVERSIRCNVEGSEASLTCIGVCPEVGDEEVVSTGMDSDLNGCLSCGWELIEELQGAISGPGKSAGSAVGETFWLGEL